MNPIEDRYFEDYVVGSVHEFGAITVTEEEVIDFAKRFDPETFHIDPQGAKKTRFGGIIASGWHTCALVMRLFVDNYLSKVASLASPGVDWGTRRSRNLSSGNSRGKIFQDSLTK